MMPKALLLLAVVPLLGFSLQATWDPGSQTAPELRDRVREAMPLVLTSWEAQEIWLWAMGYGLTITPKDDYPNVRSSPVAVIVQPYGPMLLGEQQEWATYPEYDAELILHELLHLKYTCHSDIWPRVLFWIMKLDILE